MYLNKSKTCCLRKAFDLLNFNAKIFNDEKQKTHRERINHLNKIQNKQNDTFLHFLCLPIRLRCLFNAKCR